MAEEYIEPEKEPENLNLNDLGKTMLEKALERNHGNRRKAAQELGISDRTLYRRLKQFGLATILMLCLLIPFHLYIVDGAPSATSSTAPASTTRRRRPSR